MTVAAPARTIVPRPEFRQEIADGFGVVVSACFQCRKCSSGCPVIFAMEMLPDKLIRAVHLGLKDEVLESNTIWVCASCETCSTRCPNGIDIAHMMDAARQLCVKEGRKPGSPDVPQFHRAFLGSIRRHGRVNEVEMATEFVFRSHGIKGLFGYMDYGLALLRHGKIKLPPVNLRGKGVIRNFFRQSGL